MKNLGWAKNFINSFEMSSGKFILMLGDDDLLVDSALDLINRLQNDDMGVLASHLMVTMKVLLLKDLTAK